MVPGLPASGMRTDASLSHCWPALQVPPASVLLWLETVKGATASAPPNTAAAAAPTIATLMTILSLSTRAEEAPMLGAYAHAKFGVGVRQNRRE
jgi:hypothetical protein